MRVNLAAAQLAILGMLAFAACAEKTNSDLSKTPTSSLGEFSAVLDGQASLRISELESSDNPYSTEYREWDIWLFDQIQSGQLVAHPHSIELDRAYREARQNDPTVRYWSFLIEEDQILVPMLRAMTMAREAQKTQQEERFLQIPRFAVICHPPQELITAREEAILQHTANHKPRFPRWLVQKPPHSAFLVPSGDWVLRGEPGSGLSNGSTCGCHSVDDAEHICTGTEYALYSPDGKLKNRVEGMQWWYLFYGQTLAPPDGQLDARDPWYIKFRADDGDGNLDNDVVLSIWTWDGKRVRESDVVAMSDRPYQYFKTTAGHNISRYGARQQ